MSDNSRASGAANDQPVRLMPSVAADAIDMAVIAQLRRDYGDEDGSLLSGLVEAFADEARTLQQAAKEAAAAPSSGVLGKAAHRLKSAAGTLGARQVVTICLQLEAAERAGDPAQSAQLVAGLRSAIVCARAALSRISAAAKSGAK